MTIYLLRHADAGQPWPPADDHQRTLSSRGEAQADALASHFGDGPLRIIASPAVRCVATVGPLAAHVAVETETRADLGEASPPTTMLELIETLFASDAGHDTVLCSHGNVIPEVIRLLVLRGMVLHQPIRCEKGSAWLLELDGERAIRATYRPPPA